MPQLCNYFCEQESAEEPADGEAPAPPDAAEAPKPEPVPEEPAVPQMTAKQRREEDAALAKENKMREIAEARAQYQSFQPFILHNINN